MLFVSRPYNNATCNNVSPVVFSHQSYAPAYSLRDNLDRIFDGMIRNAFFPWDNRDTSKTDVAHLAPEMEISSTEHEYRMSVELPGMSPADVKLETRENTLVLSGEKKSETREEEQRTYHVTERTYGSFERAFTLPEDADAANIAATHKDGVLTITIPRKQPEQPQTRSIEITAA